MFTIDPSVDNVTVQIYDHDTFGKDDSLGSVTVATHEIQSLVRGVRKTFDLKVDGGKGELSLGMACSL